MIKKILLYVVFAIPSLLIGLCLYFYNGEDVQSSIIGALLFLLITYAILVKTMFEQSSVRKARTTYNIKPLSVDLSEDELTKLNNGLAKKSPQDTEGHGKKHCYIVDYDVFY